MRVLAVDLGERRIGIAVSDSAGTIALPRATLERGGDPAADRAAICALVDETGAGRVVVGLPLGLDGREGPAAAAARAEIEALGAALADRGVPVEAFDERLTTVSAQRALRQAGRSARAARHVVDQAAAAVLLQAWLDRAARARG